MRFNKEDDEESVEDTWKILIYDKDCSNVISPLLRVHELREEGVTLNLLVKIFQFFTKFIGNI